MSGIMTPEQSALIEQLNNPRSEAIEAMAMELGHSQEAAIEIVRNLTPKRREYYEAKAAEFKDPAALTKQMRLVIQQHEARQAHAVPNRKQRRQQESWERRNGR